MRMCKNKSLFLLYVIYLHTSTIQNVSNDVQKRSNSNLSYEVEEC